jgi:hypothetical protein
VALVTAAQPLKQLLPSTILPPCFSVATLSTPLSSSHDSLLSTMSQPDRKIEVDSKWFIGQLVEMVVLVAGATQYCVVFVRGIDVISHSRVGECSDLSFPTAHFAHSLTFLTDTGDLFVPSLASPVSAPNPPCNHADDTLSTSGFGGLSGKAFGDTASAGNDVDLFYLL